MSSPSQIVSAPSQQTPIAAHLRIPAAACVNDQGALSPIVFSTLDQEITALTTAAGLYDLGYKALLPITGADRLRWLNGMVTNTIHALPEGHWNASFLLNAQGRIQGDANIYRTADALLFQTSRAQIARLSAHLDHFIIMDDVELHPFDETQTAVGIAGPRAPEILSILGLTIPERSAFASASINGATITLVHAHSPVVPRFELWLPATALPEIWALLQSAGAAPCGVAALEALRILQATPLYGVDIQERHLAQETGQTQMLNFNKGCYLGQEIVERIRSRATVHRTLRQFAVENAPESLEHGQMIELNAEDAERNPVGELTSLAHFALPSFTGTLALGIIRTEAVERKLHLTHSGGSVTLLDAPPTLGH
jgi:folate-binding protein YgfZ